MAKRPKKPVELPSKEAILAYIQGSPVPLGKRELARAFQVGPEHKIAFKALLRDLKRDGSIEQPQRRTFGAADRLPEIAVLEVEGLDADGEMIANPTDWQGDGQRPRVLLAPDTKGHRLANGERILARLSHNADGSYSAHLIRSLGSGAVREVVGVIEMGRRGATLRAADRTMKDEIVIAKDEMNGAEDGELVLVRLKPVHRRSQAQRAGVVVERLGSPDNPKALSLIAIHGHGIPHRFPLAAEAEAERAVATPLADRTDLRSLPLVTIDGPDARDFDDAVFAEADQDPNNPGGFRIVVAIADVAHYVTPGSALDREALKRGNSVYFPDRVVPMLPEALSNGWCSLKPKEDRGCLAVEMKINAKGEIRSHRFMRALMRSAARLTYEQVQAAKDGKPDDLTGPLLEGAIKPLYLAYVALLQARRARGTLDLDLVERQVVLTSDGKVEAIRPRERLDSHKLIEEFMIAANVAAAQALEAKHQPCMYRVHEPPDPLKLEALRQVLEGLGFSFPKGQVIRPRHFSEVLAKVEGSPAAPIVSDLVLRAQSQAHYSPNNAGHFGLALQRYAHFTSPIRRYSDLLVHRALIAGYGLGADGIKRDEAKHFEDWGEAISLTERRAQAAEREVLDRFAALYLAERKGAHFAGRVASVTRFGLFVRLDETGADGLVPIRTLPQDFYEHDERHHALIGRRWGRTFHLGDRVVVELTEADPLIGRLTFRLVESQSDSSPLAGLIKPASGARRPQPGGFRAGKAQKRPRGRRK